MTRGSPGFIAMSDVNSIIRWSYHVFHTHQEYYNSSSFVGCHISKDKNYIYSTLLVGGGDVSGKAGIVK